MEAIKRNYYFLMLWNQENQVKNTIGGYKEKLLFFDVMMLWNQENQVKNTIGGYKEKLLFWWCNQEKNNVSRLL